MTVRDGERAPDPSPAPAAATAGTEVCFLIGDGGAVLWADRSGDPAALPDSRARWEAIWDHRDLLAEVAHSHPRGPLAFSATDASTRRAVQAALGRRLTWSLVTPDGMLRWRPGRDAEIEPDEPWWASLLRAASGIPPQPADDPHEEAPWPS